jgi:glycosyltransferase involved in cell wall biosynthesis
MNILIISPFYPWPLTSGGKIRIFNLLKYLSRQHQVTLACLTDAPVADAGPLAALCREVVTVERPPAMIRDLAAFLSGSLPFNAQKYRSAGFRLALQRLLAGQTFDLVLLEFSFLWSYADILPLEKLVIDAHNIEADIIRQLRQGCSGLFRKTLYLLEEHKMRRLEERAWRDCRLCLAVSEQERKFIAAASGDRAKVTTIPNGVDLERFTFMAGRPAGASVLLLAGLDYAPNLDSVRFFLGEIFPPMRQQLTTVTVDLVGREFWRLDEDRKQTGVARHENVPEVLPFFQRAALLAVPLRHGAGTRIKILEAMASGLPVVATSKGCEGLEVESGEHLLVADTPQAFAAACLQLLTEPARAAALAVNARKLVEERYSWSQSVAALEEAFLLKVGGENE